MGCVYFVWRFGTNLTKVGMTTLNPNERLTALRVDRCLHGSEMVLLGHIDTDKPRELETKLHNTLVDYHANREWFILSETQIKKMVDNAGLISSTKDCAGILFQLGVIEKMPSGRKFNRRNKFLCDECGEYVDDDFARHLTWHYQDASVG